MLQVLSQHQVNPQGKYLLQVKAKDIRIGAGYADFEGTAIIPSMGLNTWAIARLVQPVDGPTYVQVNLENDTNVPDPTRSVIISVFGTYNYADHMSDWHPIPMNFLQVERDLWLGSDASIEMHWVLNRHYEGWAQKYIGYWVPTNYADHAVFRVEVGAKDEAAHGQYVQANIAAADNGFCSREVKGWSNHAEKYCIDSGLVVPLLSNSVYCCGFNAIINLLCAGYRLKEY